MKIVCSHGCFSVAPVRWMALCSLFLAFMASAFAQGALTGTVTNAATGRTLEGVRVAIEGTSRETYTDSQGAFRFDDVPLGAVTVSMSYTGLDTAMKPVEIRSSTPARLDVGLTSSIYQMGQLVVSGEREGNAQAVTLQRQSAGVRSIVSADAFGSLAGNPADLAIRLPGVEGESVGGDIRYVRIRGMSHQLNTVTVDGNRIADAGSAGATREFQFQTIGSDAIERIEVIKSPTPDMDADSIGGAVNMVSKSAFDNAKERRIRASFGAIWRPFDDRSTQAPRNYALSYSEVFKDRIAVAVNLGYRAHLSLIDVTSQAHQALPVGVEGPAYTYQFSFQDFRLLRTRSGGGVKVDYKLSDATRFYVNTSFNKHVEHGGNTDSVFATSQAAASFRPGYTDQFTEVLPTNNSVLTITSQSNYKNGQTATVQVGGAHRYRNLEIDYDAYSSKSKSDYAGNNNLAFTMRGIGFSIERGGDKFFPTLTMTSGPDITNLNNYTENLYTSTRMTGWDGYEGGSLHVKKSFALPVPTFIKAGLRQRNQTRKLQNTSFRGNFVGPDGVMGVNPATGINDDNLAQFGQTGRGVVDTELRKYPVLPFGAMQGAGNFSAETVRTTNPSHFREDIVFNTSQPLLNDQQFEERVSAAYIMGSVTLGKFSAMGGVRVEKTEVDAEGALIGTSPEERVRRATWVGPVTNDELRRRTIADNSGRQRRGGETQDVFPGVHLRYEPMRRLIMRLSYASNIGRPSIGQLIPRTTINYDNQTISTSNPSLKPQYADNFDATAEYYFEPAGVFSAGVFLKEIKRFIYTQGGAVVGPGQDNGFDGEYVGYTMTTQYNGGSAKVKGFELNYSQQFRFLPGFWSGFGAFANYTRMSAEGNYGAGNAITLAPTSEIAGFNPKVMNIGLSYIRHKVSVRFQYNYRGRYLASFNANQSRLLYNTARETLDIKTMYQINRNFDVYLDAVNVFNTADRRQEYYGGRPGLQHLMSPQLFFGVNARL